MSIQLENKDLINAQQMEVGIHGPDGATYLILCTGVADLGSVGQESYTFLVGPKLSRRQFVGAIASGALATMESYSNLATSPNNKLETNLILINAVYDDESNRIKVRAEVASSIVLKKLTISYNVSILAELPMY